MKRRKKNLMVSGWHICLESHLSQHLGTTLKPQNPLPPPPPS